MMEFFQKWFQALIHPKETFTKEEDNASLGRVILHVGIAGFIGGLVYIITTDLPFLLKLIYLILVPIFSIIFCMIGSAIYLLSAKLLGGKGYYITQTYLFALYSAPLAVIMSIIAAISFAVPIVNLLNVLVGIYGLYLLILALKEIHNYSTSRAIVTWIVSTIIAVGIIGIVLWKIGVPSYRCETIIRYFGKVRPLVCDINPNGQVSLEVVNVAVEPVKINGASFKLIKPIEAHCNLQCGIELRAGDLTTLECSLGVNPNSGDCYLANVTFEYTTLVTKQNEISQGVIGGTISGKKTTRPKPSPPGCRGFSEVSPISWTAESDGKFKIILTNEAESGVEISDVNVDDCRCDVPGTCSNIELEPGGRKQIDFTDCDFLNNKNSGDYYKIEIAIEYSKRGSPISHLGIGECWGSVS